MVKSINQAQRSLSVLDVPRREASFNITDGRELARIGPCGKVHVCMVRNAAVHVAQGADGPATAA